MREQRGSTENEAAAQTSNARTAEATAEGAQAIENSGSASRILHLQRAVGNAVVARMLEDEPDPVQRSAVHGVLRSPGRPLDEPVRADMEARFGADFSDVRLHTGSTAQRSAAEIGARAYTSGNHVVIGEGGADSHTLAHELTHVLQQRSGPVAGTDNGDGLKVSDPADRFEREAEETARHVMRAPAIPQPQGQSASPATKSVDRGDCVQRTETRSDANSPAPFVIRPLRTSHEFSRIVHDRYLAERMTDGWGRNFAVLEYSVNGKTDYVRAFNEGRGGDHSEEVITALLSKTAGYVPIRIFTDRSPCDGCQRKLNTAFQSRTRGQDRVAIYYAVENDCGVGEKKREIESWWTAG